MAKVLKLSNSAGKPFEIRMKADKSEADIIIYDQIGMDWFGNGVTAKGLSDELKNLDAAVKQVNVRINSPGGDVFDGITIYNRLKQLKQKKVVYIDGLAASIASIIMLAGDEIIMGEGAQVMIHKPWTLAVGDSNELDRVIDRLNDVEEQMISIYQARTGLDRNELRSLLKAETWMDAEQAKEKGFVDKTMEESLPIAASAFDKKWINRAPKNFFSRDTVVKKDIKDLNEKIARVLARK